MQATQSSMLTIGLQIKAQYHTPARKQKLEKKENGLQNLSIKLARKVIGILPTSGF
jgi:hypothetical protein